ncbi:MAG TPA: hypothetical protein V6D04_09125, partial [Candidatus Obscuribacterales bacterium]
KHMTWYVKGFVGAAELRSQLCLIETVQQGLDLLDGAIATLIRTGPDELGVEEDQPPLAAVVA